MLQAQLLGDNPLYILQNSSYSEPGYEAVSEQDYISQIVLSGAGSVYANGTYTRSSGGHTTFYHEEENSSIQWGEGNSWAVNGLNNAEEDFFDLYYLNILRENGSEVLRDISYGSGESELPSSTTSSDIELLDIQSYVSGQVNTNQIGNYTLTYNFTASDGEQVSLTRLVIVTDSIAPEITLLDQNPLRLIVAPGTNFPDPGAFVRDNYDVGRTVYGTGFVDMATPGSYLREYNATDAAGNAAQTVTRTVEILEPADTTPPEIVIFGANPVQHEVKTRYEDEGAAATDAKDGNIEVTVATNVNTNVLGTYRVRYTAADVAGNQTSTTRVVNVVDTTPPYLELVGPTQISIPRKGYYADHGATFDDNYDPEKMVYSGSNFNRLVPGTYTLTYSASDVSGNAATPVTRTVIVQPDLLPPVITLNGLELVSLGKGQPYIEAGATAEDAIDGQIQVVRTGSVDVSVVGRYVLTYTATDESGNSASTIRVVTVSSLEEDDVSATTSCGVDAKSSTTPCQNDVVAQTSSCSTSQPVFARGCGSDIWGCDDPEALNYDFRATKNDGSCVYLQPPAFEGGVGSVLVAGGTVGGGGGGEGDPLVIQVYACDTISITFINVGGPVTSSSLSNPLPAGLVYYHKDLKIEGGECLIGEYLNSLTLSNSAGSATLNFKIVIVNRCLRPGASGCTDREATNFSATAECDDGSCTYLGCMLPAASNYDPRATIPGVCVFEDGPCLPALPVYSGDIIVRGCTDPSAINYCSTATEDDGSCVFCKPPKVQITQIPDVIDWTGELTVCGSAEIVGAQTVKVTIQGKHEKTVPVSGGEWCVTYNNQELGSLEEGVAIVRVFSETSCGNSEYSVSPVKPSNKYLFPVYVGVTSSTGSCRSIHNITSFRVNGTPAEINPEFTTPTVKNLGGGSWQLNEMEYYTGGSIWAYYPLDSKDFSASITYNIIEPPPPDYSRADGIALIFSKSPFLAGLGGGLGYQGGDPNSLAIEIDTWENNHDPDNHHIAIISGGSVARHLALASRTNILGSSLEADYVGGILTVKHNGELILSYPVDIPGIIGTGTNTS